ncbi:MAG: CobW family GTP-binding protein [Verrucomicrobia bacterium]|nr:CobW family GTP-binding protein [Verrucomicrobiota bacterium]
MAGFLGAGKTTLLTRMIEQRAAGSAPRPRLAVVVNEFAGIGLDAVRLPEGDYDKWELSRGSIFCVCLRTDFIALLERIVREVKPDEIWVEATGIADVAEVHKMLSVPSLRAALHLRTVVCVVDPRTILKVLVTLRAARTQVECADLILLNKTDTADEKALTAIERELRAINSAAPILRCVQGRVNLACLPHALPRHDEGATVGHPPQQVMSVSIAESWIIPQAALDAWCASRGERIWRAKGRVRTPEGFFWLEAVMGATTWTPSTSALPLPADTTLAFVGPDLNAEEVRASIAALRK